MAESEVPSTSIYRNHTSTGSSSSTSSAKFDGKAGSYSSSSGGESFAARDKYAGQKGTVII